MRSLPVVQWKSSAPGSFRQMGSNLPEEGRVVLGHPAVLLSPVEVLQGLAGVAVDGGAVDQGEGVVAHPAGQLVGPGHPLPLAAQVGGAGDAVVQQELQVLPLQAAGGLGAQKTPNRVTLPSAVG